MVAASFWNSALNSELVNSRLGSLRQYTNMSVYLFCEIRELYSKGTFGAHQGLDTIWNILKGYPAHVLLYSALY
jgi:hypothetical protein